MLITVYLSICSYTKVFLVFSISHWFEKQTRHLFSFINRSFRRSGSCLTGFWACPCCWWRGAASPSPPPSSTSSWSSPGPPSLSRSSTYSSLRGSYPVRKTENWKKYFQQRNCAASAIYIFEGSVHIFSCRRIGRLIVGIYKSSTDTWMWKLGLRRHNFFSGNT